MLPALRDIVLSSTGARAINSTTVIQSLWSGYGEIVRLELSGSSYSSVILKHIKLPESGDHPRGWNTNLSHQRKVRSYQVEANWYQNYAQHCTSNCEVPTCLAVSAQENETVLVLTDLDASGFDLRKSRVDIADVHSCLIWLASFHARFLNSDAEGLWECGTYWHLDTRPDELAALDDSALRKAAPLIDQTLRGCRYQTLVHGDAKLANFCFSSDRTASEAFNTQAIDRQSFNSSGQMMPRVAAVDFQYIGRGCGMKDLAYFIGSCLNEVQCQTMEAQLLDFYFSVLVKQVSELDTSIDTTELEREWRAMYPVAWADFHRFIKGWSPEHWKINGYSETVTANVIEQLNA